MKNIAANFREVAGSDIGDARIPGRFRLMIEPDRKWIRHEVGAWSVGLRWLTFVYHDLVHDVKSPLFLQGRDTEYLETVEQPAVEKWMQEHLHRDMERHAATRLYGLAPGGMNDLPVERILIDRLLKQMVESEGIDVCEPAEKAGGDDDYLQLLANEQEHMATNVGGHRFELKQSGIGLPELSTSMPLAHASYCGHALNLNYRLPETICAGVIGRRLGDMIATGISELDARVVIEAVTSPTCLMDHSPTTAETRLHLEPDLVELCS